MEKVFLPPQQKMLNRNRILLVGLLLLALALIVLANLKIFIDFASVFVTVAFLLAVPFFYVLYRLNQANHISYAIGEDCLNVVWGVNRLQIPLREIDWAHHVDDFEQLVRPAVHLARKNGRGLIAAPLFLQAAGAQVHGVAGYQVGKQPCHVAKGS